MLDKPLLIDIVETGLVTEGFTPRLWRWVRAGSGERGWWRGLPTGGDLGIAGRGQGSLASAVGMKSEGLIVGAGHCLLLLETLEMGLVISAWQGRSRRLREGK